MAGFEDSAEYKLAMQAYMRRQKAKNGAKIFLNGAKKIYTTIDNNITAHRIDGRKNFRATVHRVQEGALNS